MALNIGRQGFAGVGLQSAAQVPAAIADYAPFSSFDLHGVQEQIKVPHATGFRDVNFSSVAGKAYSEGGFEDYVDSKFFGYFAVAAMGTVGVASQGSGVFLHTITRNDSNTPQYLTITNDRVVDRQNYYDVTVDELEVSVGTDISAWKAKLMGNFPQTTTSGTNTTTSGNVMTFRNAQFAFGASVSAAKGAANLKTHDFKLNIKNNAEVIHAHGAATPRSINNKGFEVTADFQLYFENTTDRDAYYNQSKQAASLQFIGNQIGGGFSEFVKFNLYQVSMETLVLETGLDSYYTEKVHLSGEFDNVAGKTLDIEIQNTKSLYI
jgi:hypothetical protein